MNYGYIRVSSDKQTVENQRFEIRSFCLKNGIEINGWIEETISGTKNYKGRALGRLLRKIKKGDVIICTELSRLGRSLFMIMDILNYCMQHECKVWSVKEGYRLGDDIQSKVLAFAFGLSAEIERKLISERTRQALALRRMKGQKLGRREGSRNQHHKLDGKELAIIKARERGERITDISRKLKVNRTTLYKKMHEMGLMRV